MIRRMTIKERSRRMEGSSPSCPHAVPGPLTSGCSTCRQRRCETLPAPQAIFARPGHQTGKWIAFSSDRNTPVRRDGERFEQSHAVSIYLMRTDGADVRRITSAGKFAGSPKWSPDGERIVFYEMDIQNTFYARLSPGRAKVGKLVDSQIVSVDVATGTRQEHTSGPGLKVSPQILSANRIGYVMKAGSRTGLAFTTGDQGANGQMRNPTTTVL